MKFLLLTALLVCISLVLTQEISLNHLVCGDYNTTNAANSTDDLKGQWYVRSSYGPQENCSEYVIDPANHTIQYSSQYQNGTIHNETIINDTSNKTVKVFKAEDATYVIWTCVDIIPPNTNQSLVVLSKNTTTNVTESVNKALEGTSINTTLLQPHYHPANICQNQKSAATTFVSFSWLSLLLVSTFTVL